MVKRNRNTHESPAGLLASRSSTRWLLLIHQIPPVPGYLRVKIGRRLRRVGAVAIKNSVYALPAGPEAYEDFRWIIKEIEAGGGEAFVSEGQLGDGLTDAAARSRFDAARNEEYRAILADAKGLMKLVLQSGAKSRRRGSKPVVAATRPALEHALAKLRRRFETETAIDFFGASRQSAVASALAEIQELLQRLSAQAERPTTKGKIKGATWVTRRDVHVDRIGSAWLIRRFIDPRPTFKFVNGTRYGKNHNELRFDMFEAEYTHVGDACTFETLVATFIPHDAALHELAEIVHDVDCKDGKYQRKEAPGLARMIAGVVARCATDEGRIDKGSELFDNLYSAFQP